MNLLESFYFLFEADASGLNKGLDEADKRAQGTEKSLNETEKAAHQLGTALGGVIRQFGGMVLASVALGSMTQNLLEAVHAADKLDEAAQARGMSVESLSALGGAAKIAGGSVEGLLGSLDALDTSLTQIDVTGKSRAAPFLKELGIDLDSVAYKGKSAMELLLPIADSFEKLSKQQQIGMGRKLGFDQGTIMLLQMGRREIEAQIAKQKELGVVTQRQAELSAKFNDEIDYTRMAFRGVWLSVAESVLPALTRGMEMLQGFAKFLKQHSQFVVGLMIALGTAIAVFVLPPLIKMAAAALVAFAPFFIIGAVVAALGAAFALMYEDVMIFLEGGDSAIGRLLEKFPVLAEVARAVGVVFSAVWDGIKMGGEAALSILEVVWDIIKGIFSSIGSVLGAAGSFLGKVLGLGGSDAAQGLAAGQQMLATAAASPIASQTSNSISNSQRSRSTAVNIGEVKVQTAATDANGIARDLGGGLIAQMRQAVNNYDDGVAI